MRVIGECRSTATEPPADHWADSLTDSYSEFLLEVSNFAA